MIGFLNCENKLLEYFDEAVDINGIDFVDIDGLVIDWTSKKNDIEFSKQSLVLDHYIKKIPIFIFDRYSSITFKEFKWLKKFNVSLNEPILNHRDGFKYTPFWIYDLYPIEYYESHDRVYNLGFKGTLKDKIKSFESYYVEIQKHSTYTVGYDPHDFLSNKKKREYDNFEIFQVSELYLDDVEFSIVIGSSNDYKIGKLNSLFAESMNNGCIPLIPAENRYYRSICTNIETSLLRLKFADLYINSTKDLKYGILMGVWEDVEDFYPEMKVNYIVDKINHTIKSKTK